MHLRNVEIFCDVVGLRSFSRAAAAHDVSQSSASQAVLMLEKRLGAGLIDRSKRPFELTEAGEVYFDGCRKLLDSFRKIEDRVRQLRNKVVGKVRVAAIYSVGLLQMDAYARQFAALYPEAELQLEYLHPDEVYSRIRADEADLGLVSFPRDRGEICSIPWQEQPMILIVPTSHRLAAVESIRVRELEGEKYIAFTTELTIRRQVDRWLKQAKVTVDVVHEFDNVENIKSAVEIGSGVAILPEPTVRREVAAGTVAAVRLENVSWQRPLGLVHKRNAALTAAAAKFVELLQEDPETFIRNGKQPSSNGNGRASNGRKRPAGISRRRTASKTTR